MNQEQIQPDYNYILQQQAPEPKKSKKPVFVYALFGLLIVSIIGLALVSLTVRPSNNVATNLSDPEFILDIKNGRTEQAYDQLTDGVKTSYPDQKTFSATVASPLKQTFSIYACQKTKQSESTPVSHVYKCQKDQTTFWFGLATNTKDDGSTAVVRLCPVSNQEMTTCA